MSTFGKIFLSTVVASATTYAIVFGIGQKFRTVLPVQRVGPLVNTPLAGEIQPPKFQKKVSSLFDFQPSDNEKYSKVAGNTTEKFLWACKSKLSTEKFPGDQCISETKLSMSPDNVSNFNLERSFTVESGKPFEIRVDLSSLLAKQVIFKRSSAPRDGMNEEVVVEIVA